MNRWLDQVPDGAIDQGWIRAVRSRGFGECSHITAHAQGTQLTPSAHGPWAMAAVLGRSGR